VGNVVSMPGLLTSKIFEPISYGCSWA